MILDIQADSSYHVLWKTSQRARTGDDGSLKTATFDADRSPAYNDIGGDDWPSQFVHDTARPGVTDYWRLA